MDWVISVLVHRFVFIVIFTFITNFKPTHKLALSTNAKMSPPSSPDTIHYTTYGVEGLLIKMGRHAAHHPHLPKSTLPSTHSSPFSSTLRHERDDLTTEDIKDLNGHKAPRHLATAVSAPPSPLSCLL